MSVSVTAVAGQPHELHADRRSRADAPAPRDPCACCAVRGRRRCGARRRVRRLLIVGRLRAETFRLPRAVARARATPCRRRGRSTSRRRCTARRATTRAGTRPTSRPTARDAAACRSGDPSIHSRSSATNASALAIGRRRRRRESGARARVSFTAYSTCCGPAIIMVDVGGERNHRLLAVGDVGAPEMAVVSDDDRLRIRRERSTSERRRDSARDS